MKVIALERAYNPRVLLLTYVQVFQERRCGDGERAAREAVDD